MAVTVEDLKDVIDTSLGVQRLEQCLSTAEGLIVAYIDPKADATVTDSLRDQIKVWLAAHFAAIMDPEVKEESADGVRVVFRGSTDKGLDATMYGQQAKMMDPTGMLNKVGKASRRRLNFLFSEPRDEASDP